MRTAVVALILLACAVMAAVAMHNEPDKATILVDASFTKQPAYPLFTICPLDRRNRPILLDERIA